MALFTARRVNFLGLVNLSDEEAGIISGLHCRPEFFILVFPPVIWKSRITLEVLY